MKEESAAHEKAETPAFERMEEAVAKKMTKKKPSLSAIRKGKK